MHAGKQAGLSQDIGEQDFDRLVMKVSNTLRALRWDIPDDFLEKTHYLRVVKELDWTASPGYPYFHDAPNNGSFFGVVAGVPDEDRVDLIWAMVQKRLDEDVADPIRLFIKPEPHKEEKLKAGRYRLIYSIGIIDQIIDHMLFDVFNTKVLENHIRTPLKVGWAPVKGGWKVVPHGLKIATDNSSHDQSRRLWQCEATLAVRAQLCRNLSQRWLDLATKRFRHLYVSPLLVTSGGLILRQRNPGRQKSGTVLTLVDNSLDMLVIHTLVSTTLGVKMPELWCIGDDVLMREPENLDAYVAELRKHSIVKFVDRKREFAGYEFDGTRVEPIYPAKHAFNLLHVADKNVPETFASYALNYHRSSRKAEMRARLEELCEIPSEKILDLIWNGVE